ncbi:hypothetical protein V0R50_07775 [Pseudomonas sp. 148P]|uniref:Uncharacterized protein n=1 Tax=Pseudomonas ulcerans TaxID=3115852 RepID=A0ABU7HNM7_9PSED|nr:MULTISPECIES: hypothetical protein [unclassified Pseudomonas]MEE1923618.1 hypothetical protein [Pseudomonas sp. 147P]MEE1933116.1 hypothetical protein [Pseudomonas sp. 148P]
MRLPATPAQDEPHRTRHLLQGAQLSDAIGAHLDSMKRLQVQVSHMTQAAALLEIQLSSIEDDLDQVRAQLAARPRL